ncbi:MAG TPA: class I SAM-dependent methyltransferase [Dehalococcoidia bacterium]|nr:class I SAM-dependent methyltransferase [Dehalococcoidia bacterium]HIN24941.1 class I SAM-dependent methyltransferase [Dehalococcoidia bacterium]
MKRTGSLNIWRVPRMSSKFTEQETEIYYDSEDAFYRSFWDEGGSVHWGVFDESTGDDFLKACANLNDLMVAKAGIDSSSRVLDLGCGNGTTAIWLSGNQNCHVTGVDLSGVRVQNAKDKMAGLDQPEQTKLAFEKASATELPFEEGTFSHLWCQAVIYHVPDKEAALSEAYRVLKPGGIMVFDDLIKPQPDISAAAKEFVYDRLLFDTPYSFESYQEALKETGFEILEAHDLSSHLKNSYLRLVERTPKTDNEHAEHYEWLTNAYQETAKAVDNQELGWGLFVCQK